MKKLIILTIVGLILGMAGAATMVIAREKQARAAAIPAAADSMVAQGDSAEHVGASGEPTQADSAEVRQAHGDSAAAGASIRADSAAHVTVSPGASANLSGSRSDSLHAEVVAASSPAGPDEQRLARIFAAMRPEEAARVLEQMTDPEIRLLLSHLRDRQAAAIMSNISPERAAVISSAVIRGERNSP